MGLIRYVVCLFVCLGASWCYSAPTIVSIGGEESLGGIGRLSDIDVDSQKQPHVACDIGGSGNVICYDRINGSWRSNIEDMPGSQFYNPRLEINNQDQAWISGAMWYPYGCGIIVRNNVTTNPQRAGSMSHNYAGILGIGNLSLDPRWENQTVMYWTAGYWSKLQFNGAWTTVDEGHAGPLYGGEKHDFFVSKAYAIHDKPGTAAWHFCTDWGYQNMARSNSGKGVLDWASFSAYPEMGSDHLYPGVVSDHNISSGSFGDHTAYLVAAYRGIVMNIWRPTDANGNGSFQFPTYDLLVVDAAGSSGHPRFEPQMCPANNGGVWVIYTKSGWVQLCYVPKETTSAADLVKTAVCPGSIADVAVDTDGNLHIVYQNGGIKYRKITVSGDAINGDDMLVFNPAFTGGRARMSVLGTNGAAIATGAAASTENGTDFGEVATGTVVTNTFSIVNRGKKALTISGCSTNGDGAASFVVQGLSTNVPKKTNVTFSIAFNPLEVTNYTGFLSISNSSANSPYLINVQGTGIAPTR